MDAPKSRRLRVLLSAFAIAPNQGSEPGIGWNTAIRLAKDHDVTVLCGDLGPQRTTDLTLQEYFRAHGQIAGLEICYVPPSRLTRFYSTLSGKPGLWFFYDVAYTRWQKDAFRKASCLHAEHRFDLAHQLTFGSYTEPGELWRLPIPFFWGPISGADSPPLSIMHIGGIRMCIRFIANPLLQSFSRQPKKAARKAVMTWVSTTTNLNLIRRWGGKAELQCDTGTLELAKSSRTKVSTEPLCLIWSGLHIPRKALRLALYALAKLPKDLKCHMEILGSGQSTAQCKQLARDLDISHLITWRGALSQIDALEFMSKAHALLHTSIHEGTPQVVLEALSLGLPVICHDACGMRTAVTDQCGIKVPLTDLKTSIQGFAQAIEQLTDLSVYNRLSAGAIERVRELTWDKKVELMSKAYLKNCLDCDVDRTVMSL